MSLIRTVLGGLMFLAVAALVVWLVYSNDQSATLKLAGLWNGEGVPRPFQHGDTPTALMLPLGLWYFAFTILGIFIGLFLGWFIAGQTRVNARKQGRRARQAEQAFEKLRQETEDVKAEIDDLKMQRKTLEAEVRTKETKALLMDEKP